MWLPAHGNIPQAETDWLNEGAHDRDSVMWPGHILYPREADWGCFPFTRIHRCCFQGKLAGCSPERLHSGHRLPPPSLTRSDSPPLTSPSFVTPQNKQEPGSPSLMSHAGCLRGPPRCHQPWAHSSHGPHPPPAAPPTTRQLAPPPDPP